MGSVHEALTHDARFLALTQRLPIGVYELDAAGRITYLSERCAAIDADALHWRRRWLQLLRRILLLLTLLLLLLLEPRRRVESLLLSHVLGKGLLSRL